MEYGSSFSFIITFATFCENCNILEDPLIPSDNNDSERGIRKLKIKLKNSGTFWSELGADAFLELHSIVETAKKHDLSPYKAIRALWRCTDSYGIR